jgi:DNA mismatch repair protein MutS
VIEYLVRRVRAKTIFTTHYHEVTALAGTYDAVDNACLQVRDEGGEVTFLYKVLPGVSSHSYGIHVARLAGLPEEVVARAASLVSVPASLPQGATPEMSTDPPPQVGGPLSSPVEERLRRLDPLHTTPFEALQVLHELRELLIQGTALNRPPVSAPR